MIRNAIDELVQHSVINVSIIAVYFEWFIRSISGSIGYTYGEPVK